ncbi:unnamed protein product [Mytilus edulis]|uniref:Uncharacterized protein n=1 Tax=Mytilus edulis TaxID=6550 RepID=A0A8S3QG89_MYTED|nr:unnamed protein product [Mytilus edulis]
MKHYRNIKENLKPNEALVHVDFAENFQCKLANEIQSMHFGASKKQLTLHTGVFYTALSSQTFCAVSGSLDHNPCSNFQDSAVFVYEVGKQEIDNKGNNFIKGNTQTCSRNVKTPSNIVLWCMENILYRDVSCTCVKGSFHVGHDMKVHSPGSTEKLKTEKRKKVNIQKQNTKERAMIKKDTGHYNHQKYRYPKIEQ